MKKLEVRSSQWKGFLKIKIKNELKVNIIKVCTESQFKAFSNILLLTNYRKRIKKKSNYSKEYLFSLGSIVQKGKFSAAASLVVNTLKNVDFLYIK
jgi:hypothetical protein